MRFPVHLTTGHKGKALELDSERETITLIGLVGEQLGTVTWDSVINLIRGAGEQAPPAESRAQQRASLLVKVRYSTPEGKRLESRATGIGGGGLFIESTAPLRVGTELVIELALPDRPVEWLQAKGTVSWVCPKSDQYTFFPGMGVRFSEIAPEVRARILELVTSLKRSGR